MLRRYFLTKYIETRSKGFFKELNGLLDSQYYSKAELINLQEEKTQKIIKFAYENIPYYKDVFDRHHLSPSDFHYLEDLQKFPILTKANIKNDIQKLTPQTQQADTFIRRTSGSTGTPFKIISNRRAAMIERTIFWRFLLSMGYDWGDQIVMLWGAAIVEPDKRRVFQTIKRKMSDKIWNIEFFDTYDLDNDSLKEIIMLLSEDTPKILRGYVSSIQFLAQEIMKAGIQVNLKGVTTTAEKLFDYQRKDIEKAFDQKMYDQYGCGECLGIAFECEKHSGLHVASEHVVLELVSDDDNHTVMSDKKAGRVILTDLDNYAMPLIRYENNDLAKWSSGTCSCGRHLPVLERIEGRVYEMLTVPGGKKIHGGFFDEVYIEMKFGDRYSIDDLRIIQEDLYNYRLEFVMRGELSEKDVSALKGKYRQYLGDVNVKIQYVKSIPPTKTGKRIFVIPCQ